MLVDMQICFLRSSLSCSPQSDTGCASAAATGNIANVTQLSILHPLHLANHTAPPHRFFSQTPALSVQ